MTPNNIDIKNATTYALFKARAGSILMGSIMAFFFIMSIFMVFITGIELSKPVESVYDDNSFFTLIFFVSIGFIFFFGHMAKNCLKQILAINKELATRPDFEDSRAQYRSDTNYNNKVYIIAIAIFIGLFLLMSSTVRGCSGGGSGSGCTVCGKSASKTFQGSRYCTTHYNNAVKWAIDNPK